MQAELEKWIEQNQTLDTPYMIYVYDLRALLAGKVLCDGIAVDCPECSGDGYHWGRVNRANKRIGCPVCNEAGKLYAPASPLGNASIAGNADILPQGEAGKEGGE
jgi:hypothetical protein